MNLAASEINRAYHEVIVEYNNSPLATHGGFIYEPTPEKIEEIRECLEYIRTPGAVFLDIGTGMGIAPRFFKKIGCRAITFDNPQSGGAAAQNAALAQIEVLSGDILKDKIPLPDDSVDCILFADVIEHLIHSPKFAVKEFFRILKPGGACVATTPNAIRLSVRLRVLLGYSNWPNLFHYFDDDYHGGHHHEYTPFEFKYVFSAVGFKLKKFALVGSVASVNAPSLSDLQPKYRGKDKTTHSLITFAKVPIYALEKIFPFFRPNMILVAQKPGTYSTQD